MGDAVRRIQTQLDRLSPEERALVRAELGVGEEAVAEPREVAAAWQAEVEQALREVEDGSAELDDWEEVDRELEDLLGSDRS
jgi:hypothetical protein